MNVAHVTGPCWKCNFSDGSSWQNLLVCYTKPHPNLLLLNVLVDLAQNFVACKICYCLSDTGHLDFSCNHDWVMTTVIPLVVGLYETRHLCRDMHKATI